MMLPKTFYLKRRAISLMEMLVVLGIIAIVSAISIPLISSYSPSLKLSSSARDVSGKLRQAQEEAVTTQIKHGMKFHPDLTPPTMDVIKREIDPITHITTDTILETVTLPKGIGMSVSIMIPDQEIFFSPDGGPSPNGNISVCITSTPPICQLNDPSKTINISPAGMIKLQ